MRTSGIRTLAGTGRLDAHAAAYKERVAQLLSVNHQLDPFSSEGPPPSKVAESTSQSNSHERWISRDTCVRAEHGKHWTYEAPLSKALMRVKVLSLVSCGTTLVSAPFLVTAGPADVSWYAKASLAATLSAFGLFTTGLLHWFTYPYVHRLIHHVGTDTCTATQLNIFGRLKTTSFKVSDVAVPQTARPMVSFAVAKRYYFIDENSFTNPDLYDRLVPLENRTDGNG